MPIHNAPPPTMRFSGGLFSDAGRNFHQILHSPVSWAWALGVMAIQAWVSSQGGPEYLGGWFENLGLSRDGFLSGKIWQILTYGLMHGAWWHAGVNALFVWLIGPRIEHVAGRAAMMRVMVAGVLGGGAAHLLLGSGLLVGLSGACMALLLMLVTLSPQSRMFPLPVSGRNLGMGILIAALVLALANPSLGVPGLSAVGRMLVNHGMGGWFQMGHACHFGGGLAGWSYGRWILRPRVSLESLRRDRARREG
jgi:membrane associated rhomboid family serine protease